MPQTLEPGTKASTAKGKRTGGDAPQTANAEQRSLEIGVLASKSATNRDLARGGISFESSKSQVPQRPFCSRPRSRFTDGYALAHGGDRAPRIRLHIRRRARSRRSLRPADLLGVSVKGWINIMTCVVFGFAVGAVPDGALTWPMQHAVLYAEQVGRWCSDVIDGVITAAGWVKLRQARNLLRLVRGSRRVRLLGRSDMVRHLRKSCRRRSCLILSIHRSPRGVEQRTAAFGADARAAAERKEKQHADREKTQ